MTTAEGQENPLLGWRGYQYGEVFPSPVIEARSFGPTARYATVIVPRNAGPVTPVTISDAEGQPELPDDEHHAERPDGGREAVNDVGLCDAGPVASRGRVVGLRLRWDAGMSVQDFSDEQVFEAEHPVRYLLRRGTAEDAGLLVIFSGFHKPFVRRYNYVRSLADTTCHRLYVMDDLGARGCYYLGAGGDYFVERSVAALIAHVAGELGLDASKVVTGGTSKGATAAVYYAVKHGYAAAIVGAPQSYIATYLTRQSQARDVAELIAGDLSEQSLAALDRLLFETVRASPHRPELTFYTSEKDLHYARHLVPLLELLAECGYSASVIMGDYERHSAVGIPYSEFLAERVRQDPSLRRLRSASPT